LQQFSRLVFGNKQKDGVAKNVFPDLGRFLLAVMLALAATVRVSADEPKITREQAEALLNEVAAISQLPQIERATPGILSAIEFSPGHRYGDFNPASDKVATYGLTALVAGGVAAKLGLFKGLWIAILAAKKFIIIGIAALAALGTQILQAQSALAERAKGARVAPSPDADKGVVSRIRRDPRPGDRTTGHLRSAVNERCIRR
jgi:hypothetical protein